VQLDDLEGKGKPQSKVSDRFPVLNPAKRLKNVFEFCFRYSLGLFFNRYGNQIFMNI
jgi:hypothetical protein